MDLSDKAAETPDVCTAKSLVESHYEMTGTELVEADELTEEGEFPKYGDFLPVEEYSPYDDTHRGEVYIEVSQRLAQWLTENVDVGERFEVERTWKEDGERRYEATTVGE